MLAILFGGGLVLFGVGGNVSGGLVDAFRGSGGGAPTTARSPTSWSGPSARAARNPDNPNAWIALVRAQFNLASSPAGSDAETGSLTDRGQQAVVEVTQAWERYEKLKPKKIDSNGASFAALAYGALQDYDKAVELQRPRSRRGRARTGISSSPTSPTVRIRWRRRPRGPGGRAPNAVGPAQHRALADQGPEEAGRRSRPRSRRPRRPSARRARRARRGGHQVRPAARARAPAARPRRSPRAPVPIIARVSRAVSSTGRAGDS